MKPNSLYTRLELIEDLPPQPTQTDYSLSQAWALAKARLGQVASGLLTYLCGSTDLRVTVRRDRSGNPLLVAYDPVTQQRHTFSTEQELRAWIDQRYYQ